MLAGMSLTSQPALAQRISSTVLKPSPRYMDWANTMRTGAMFSPQSAEVSTDRPSWITKEPPYRAKPKYGVIVLGNGPLSRHAFALDEPGNGVAKIYIDLGGDGDLTRGSDGQWPVKPAGPAADYRGTFVFRASYGTANKETAWAPYGLNLYRSPDRGNIGYFRAAVQTGRIRISGKWHDVLVSEDAADGLYNKRFNPDNPRSAGTWLMLDREKEFDARGTFQYSGRNYQALLSADGSHLTLKPTYQVIKAPKIGEVVTPPLLSVGIEAPDFTVLGTDGAPVKLSSFKGKVVVLDFWATWCGPCQASLPHLQKLYEEFRDKNVAFLAINVWDDKQAYEKWIAAKKQYSFPIALDPAGRKKPNVPSTLYKVSGIPTSYVIDAEGKVAGSFVGYDDGDQRMDDMLKKLTSK